MGGGKIVVSALKEAFPTRVMWRPPQKDANGDWAQVPMTLEKSTELGEWVATCDGMYRYDFSEGVSFTMGFPDNYEIGQSWFKELLSGPQ